MKLHSLLAVTTLALLLASCSSSSPVESDLDASSDTEIAGPLADGENGTDESDLEDESDETGQSNETDIDEQTDENADLVESENPDQNATTENNSEENNTDNLDQNATTENNGEENSNDNLDQNATTENNSDENSNDNPDQNVDPVPVIDPNSTLGQLQSRVQLLTGESLLRLNEAISSGELLTGQQEDCIGAFDPALGEPLLAIDCDQPLSVDDLPIYATVAAFSDTPQCRASLQNGNADDCSVSQAQLTVNTLWTVPDPAIGQIIQRPQPTVGANIQYAIEPDRLLVENLDSALSGVYSCEYDLSTGLSIGTSAESNCDLQFDNLVNLIDTRLADVI